MSAGSVRLHVPLDLHQHGTPPDDGDEHAAVPDGRDEDDAGGPASPTAGRLWRENGALMYQDAGGGEPRPARMVWARPLSGRGGPVSVMLAGKKKELAYIASLDQLSEDSRRIALEELDAGAVLPVITVIHEVKPRFGNYYWDVETDRGRRKFLLSSPENNTYRSRPDAIVIKDVSGNSYEISSLSGLSRASRREMERAL